MCSSCISCGLFLTLRGYYQVSSVMIVMVLWVLGLDLITIKCLIFVRKFVKMISKGRLLFIHNPMSNSFLKLFKSMFKSSMKMNERDFSLKFNASVGTAKCCRRIKIVGGKYEIWIILTFYFPFPLRLYAIRYSKCFTTLKVVNATKYFLVTKYFVAIN